MPSNLPPTEAKWFDVWAAGVAVNTMCVQHGFTGTAVGLGMSILVKNVSDAGLRLDSHIRNIQGIVG